MVIACDDKNNWRRKVFPYYKANRKKAREASEFDWNSIFESLNKDFEWDGTYGGRLVQDGMYTYEVVYKLPYIDDRRTFTGSIAIIR